MIRVFLRSLLALALVAASVVVFQRVLRPAELLEPGSADYPQLAAFKPNITGRMALAPLMVDGRMRVYAAKRQIRADGPIASKSIYTPHWSFRRWPQQLNGVVASGTMVISRWSDGQLVAIDGLTGRIAWRAPGPPAGGYTGHRTGAVTVWDPPGLHLANGSVVVSSGRELASYDVTTGSRRFTISVPAGCTDGFTTAGGRYVCPTGAYDVATGQPVASWPAGPYTPLGCAVAASLCAGLRDGASQGWRVDAAAPGRLAQLDQPGSTFFDGVVVSPTSDGRLESSNLRTGVHRLLPGGQVLGMSRGRLLILLPSMRLRVVDLATGEVVIQIWLAVSKQELGWKLGHYQVVAGHIAMERLSRPGPANPDAVGYYVKVNPVVLCSV